MEMVVLSYILIGVLLKGLEMSRKTIGFYGVFAVRNGGFCGLGFLVPINEITSLFFFR